MINKWKLFLMEDLQHLEANKRKFIFLYSKNISILKTNQNLIGKKKEKYFSLYIGCSYPVCRVSCSSLEVMRGCGEEQSGQIWDQES